MAVTQIRIYFQNNPLLNSQGNNFTLGYIDDTGTLFNLSNTAIGLNIVILEPSSAMLINNNETILMAASTNNVTLRLKISYQGYTQYYSFIVIPPLPQVVLQDIYNDLIQYLPQNVYSTAIDANTYPDNLATATVIYQLYDNPGFDVTGIYSFREIINNIFPHSGAYGWEYFLTGNNRLLFQTSTQYGALLQHIYDCEINNNSNPYWLSYNISKYIYLWINKQRFVYISENSFEILSAFVLNLNELGKAILTSSGDGTNTVTFYVLTNNPDSTSPITTAEQAQINGFIRQITRAGVNVAVDYTHSAADFNLTYLGDTYYKDPRQANTYCIAYNQNILDQALGYTGTLDQELLSNLISFSITPANGSTLTVGTSYPVTITTNPPWIGVLPVEQYIQLYSSDDALMSISFDGTTLSLNPLAAGDVSLNMYLGVIYYADGTAYDYTITP